jgi:hypothetical protein
MSRRNCALRRVLKEELKTWAFVALVIAAYGGLRYCAAPV